MENLISIKENESGQKIQTRGESDSEMSREEEGASKHNINQQKKKKPNEEGSKQNKKYKRLLGQ